MSPGPAGVVQLQELVLRIINISVGIAFIVLTAVLVWAGIRFLTSGGEKEAIAAATSTVTWALLGILFLVLAWLFLLLIQAFTGVKILEQFCIGFPGGLNNCPAPGAAGGAKP